MDETQATFTPDQVYRAEIVEVIEEGSKTSTFGSEYTYQLVRVKLENNNELEIEHGKVFQLTESKKVKKGEAVVVLQSTLPGGQTQHYIIDKYRLDKIAWIVLAFFALIIGLSRFKGIGSILGLGVTFLVILYYVVPKILAGENPILVSILGSSFVVVTTMFLAHGVSKRTAIALFSTLISLGITGVLAYLFTNLAYLTGLGSEEAYGLTLGGQASIDLKGLLLGGIIIGALGVLDDVTVTQSAAIFEIHKANPSLKLRELFKRGLVVGKEHIASVVNTLFLAYSGASLPLFIILVNNPNQYPAWFLFNGEGIAEEIIRTLAGSMGLILAVPITTFIAAWVISKKGVADD